MHFTKPAWVQHKDPASKGDSSKRLSIFSIHVHPDGSRIATGGLDAKIRIWSTKPILNPSSEASNKPPKSLCTLTMHTGPVLTVRWAHSGRWLASGSDDEIVMIWDLDPNARGKVWGTDEVNVEGWKPMKRLPGHESDVTDVAWSPEDRYLASVGLDSKVLIWCGYTLERLHKLDQHQGFVKGVCWDPVGEYLATQSDDRTVKIWRTTDWALEAEVRKPFEDSPGSTFFRRLSWSPDGAHITASNATNNKGFVFIAAVITRNTWTSEISLVGHENTVEVAAYNPHIFLRNTNAAVATANICSVVALGADDRSVSIWQTKSARPLIVAKEVFERQIMDLSWSWDGMTLYAASSDGTIAAFHFDPAELEGIAPHSVQEQYLSKFGFKLPPVPSGYSHVGKTEDRFSTPASPRSHSQNESQMQSQNGFGSQVNGSGERVNVLVAKRNKKRATLAQPNSIPSAATSSGGVNGMSSGPRRASLIPIHDSIHPESSRTSSFFPPPDRQPYGDIDMADAFPQSFASKGKVRAVDFDDAYPDARKARERGVALSVSPNNTLLNAPPLHTQVSAASTENKKEAFQADNKVGGPTEVQYLIDGRTEWLDYVPSPVLVLKTTPGFCAVGMQDGTVNVYSKAGRKLLPPLTTGAPAAFMAGDTDMLTIVTTSGTVYSWNIVKKIMNFPPTSIRPVYDSVPDISIASVAIQTNGYPILKGSNGIMYLYDAQLMTWVKLADKWWAGSEASFPANQGIISGLEQMVHTPQNASSSSRSLPMWDSQMTLGHLETRLYACQKCDSQAEYRQTLAAYAKKLADGGHEGKGHELIRDLVGPAYSHSRQGEWTATIVGLSKRDLLRDVLGVFHNSRHPGMSNLASRWQQTLNQISHG